MAEVAVRSTLRDEDIRSHDQCLCCSRTHACADFLVGKIFVGRTCLPVAGSMPSVGRARHRPPGIFLID